VGLGPAWTAGRQKLRLSSPALFRFWFLLQSNARGSTSICSSKDPYRDGCHVLCCDLQGLGDTDDRVTPHVVEALTSTDVSLVSCGGEYTMAISGEFLIAHLYNLWSSFNRLTLRHSVHVGYTRSFHRHAARLLRHQARYCIIRVFICPAGACSRHAQPRPA